MVLRDLVACVANFLSCWSSQTDFILLITGFYLKISLAMERVYKSVVFFCACHLKTGPQAKAALHGSRRWLWVKGADASAAVAQVKPCLTLA